MAKAKQEVIKLRQSLFWDVEPETIDPRKDSSYVISRIMEFGNRREAKWLLRYYKPLHRLTLSYGVGLL